MGGARPPVAAGGGGVFSLLLLIRLFTQSAAGESVEWETVTNSNFSSQIRLHSHVLLIVTVPWSGESRSLMKDIARSVADKQEELRYLKLLVVSRHSDKILADVLGASEGITLIYYHHSTSYKYQGRLRAQNILSSVYHFMSLQANEAPLTPLSTQDDLENFLQSTDKAILLLEFCGWSIELLNRRNLEIDENIMSLQNRPENGGFLEDDFSREAGGKLAFEKMKIEKIHALENDELSCRIQSGMANSPLFEQFTRTNQSDSQGIETNADMSCTTENFDKFKSFFPRFMRIAREHILPTERQRFGLILEKSLLPFLNVGNPERWLVVLHFSGCSDCSKVLGEGDDLRSILQIPHSLVKELDVDGNSESMFPASRPSVILFVDRSSESSRIRGESNSALQVLRKFVRDYHFDRSRPHSLSDQSSHYSIKGPVAHKIMKLTNNMAVHDEDQGVSLDKTLNTQVNSVYDILAQLLHQKKHALGTKETKISLVAKEVGFQLLSDDFGVQIVDSSPSDSKDSQLNYIKDNAITSLEDQASELPAESNEDSVVIDKLLDSDDAVAFDDKKQLELTNMETSPQQDQEIATCSEISTNKLTSILVEELQDDKCISESSEVSEDDKSFSQENLRLFTCPAKDSFNLVKESPAKTCTDGSKQNPSGVISSEVMLENNAAEVIQSAIDEWPVQKLPFNGSFFFSDGGYQLLKSLTGRTNIPSLVILDPALQQHYVFPEETDISYSSLVNFIEKFLNGSLTPFIRTMSPVRSSRKFPRPPFVNQDFHEADSIPQVTANTFCELIFGYKPCEMGNELSMSHIEKNSVCKMDVLVLFSTPSCGFCQRMELIVREVYRALENFTALLKSGSTDWDPVHIHGNNEGTSSNGLPSIFLMDCTLNDCGSILKSMGKTELYPTLLLFPAENKSAITYEGYTSVINIIEFLISHGRNSHYLAWHRGFLYNHSRKERMNTPALRDEPSAVYDRASVVQKKFNKVLLNSEIETRGDDHLLIGSHSANNLNSGGSHIIAGSILTATTKLLNSVPFDNSTILIVTADKNQGIEGLIINKQISWDVFKKLHQQVEVLRQAPLFYGGPVSVNGLPLVSLAQKHVEGYVEVTSSIYFGNPSVTRLTVQEIGSGHRNAYDYWFFLGYSAWGWDQLFEELATGAWQLSESPIDRLNWPDT